MKKAILIISVVYLLIGQAGFANPYENNVKKQLEQIAEQNLCNDDIGRSFTEQFFYGKSANKYNVIIRNILEQINNTVSDLSMILLITLIFTILHHIQMSFKIYEVSKATYCVFFLSIVAIVIKNLNSVLLLGINIVNNITTFVEVLIPLIMSILISSGYVTYSTVISPLVALSVVISSEIIKNVIVPIASIYLLLSIMANFDQQFNLKRMLSFIKTIIMWLIVFGLVIFTGIISVEGWTGASIDNFSAKALKYTIGNFVPYVGKILSDAADTIAGSLGIIKNTSTVFGIIAIIIIIGLPLAKILIISFGFKLTAALVEIYSDKKFAQFLNDYGDSILIVFSLVLSSAILFIVVLASILWTIQISR